MAQKEIIEDPVTKPKRSLASTNKLAKPAPVNPEEIDLYGGLSGAELALDEFEIVKGLSFHATYAHVMAPYLMAFKPPPKGGAPHPAPWRAAHGGLGLDVTIGIKLERDARPTNFNRINTLWWALALTRLKTGAAIRLPIISDIDYRTIPSIETEPNLWAIEMSSQQLLTCANPPQTIGKVELLWMRENFCEGAKLMEQESFNRAFQTLDGARWMHSPGAAMVTVWAALETLFRPGQQQITKRLSAMIATFLESGTINRDRTYQSVRDLYYLRSGAAHASKTPEAATLLASFDIARRSFIKCIEERQLPNPSQLLRRWRNSPNDVSGNSI